MSAHAHDEHHVTPIKTYLAVFGALMVLTVLTVLVSTTVDLHSISPALSLGVALLIATAKASLVVLFFMHVLHDDRFIALILAVCMFFLALFFSITMIDFTTRGMITTLEDNQTLRNERGIRDLGPVEGNHHGHGAADHAEGEGDHAEGEGHEAPAGADGH